MRKLNSIILLMMAATGIMGACSQQTETDKSATVIENIMTRVSVRSYTSDAVPAQMTEKLLRCAMAAPSGKNRQPWEFVVVDDRQVLDTLASRLKYAKMLAKAPMAIVVAAAENYTDKDGQLKFNHDWMCDASAATENLLLAAHAMGLGAVWTAADDEERAGIVRQTLGMPSEIHPLCVVAIGWPDGDNTPKDKWKPEKIHFNKWGQRK